MSCKTILTSPRRLSLVQLLSREVRKQIEGEIERDREREKREQRERKKCRKGERTASP